MDAKRLAVELQLSAKRGTVSGEQVNAVVETLLEMADKLERLEAENAGLQERIENQRRKLEHEQTPEYVAALEAENAELKREAADTIEGLRDSLQEDGEQTCHATQANYEHCKYSTERGWRDTSKYAELFGTPERAARALAVNCYGATSDACDTCVHADCDGTLRNKPVLSAVYDALLEWLRCEV